MSEKEQPVKIVVVAERLGVTSKTVYNWIENEYLVTVKPGYVLESQARRAQVIAHDMKVDGAKQRSSMFARDRSGHFSFLKHK
jgi:hypothetical protein